jgi:hypothetical protein
MRWSSSVWFAPRAVWFAPKAVCFGPQAIWFALKTIWFAPEAIWFALRGLLTPAGSANHFPSAGTQPGELSGRISRVWLKTALTAWAGQRLR